MQFEAEVVLLVPGGECLLERNLAPIPANNVAFFALFRSEISIAQQRTFPGVVQLMKLKLNC